jgi:hypothetical protein
MERWKSLTPGSRQAKRRRALKTCPARITSGLQRRTLLLKKTVKPQQKHIEIIRFFMVPTGAAPAGTERDNEFA